MNALLDTEILPGTTGAWLEMHGWRAAKGNKWQHETPIPIKDGRKSRAPLRCRHDSSAWEAWELWRGAIVPPTVSIAPGAGVLMANAALPGPGKYVGQDSNPVNDTTGLEYYPTCRFDLPRELLGQQGEGDLADLEHPVQAWVRDVTALATGVSSPARSPAAAPAALHPLLDKGGWPTTSAEGLLRISVSLPGLFRQILIDLAGTNGPRLWCELVDMAEWAPASRQAAVHLALAANDRLRLARFALCSPLAPRADSGSRSEPSTLIAEVVLGSARVPGAWLDVALECVHAAVVLTARELSALRDPELANWYLAAHGLSQA